MIKDWRKFNEAEFYDGFGGDDSYGESGVRCVNDSIDTKILLDLTDERDDVSVGDMVIATYFNGGFDTYIFEVERFDAGPEDESDYVYGNSYKCIDLNNAYHVVKLETYNDFVNPEKILEKAPPYKVGCKLLYTSEDIREDCFKSLVEKIDESFISVHEKYKTISGDSDFITENLISIDLLDAMVSQVCQNMDMNSVVNTVKSSRVDVQLFREIKDERDYIENGDDIIIMFLNYDGFKIIETIALYRPSSGFYFIFNGGDRLGSRMESISDSLYVIKKSTYEDFGGKIDYNASMNTESSDQMPVYTDNY